MSMDFIRKLPIPMEVKEKYPVSYKASQTKSKIDSEISDIFTEKRKATLAGGLFSALKKASTNLRL